MDLSASSPLHVCIKDPSNTPSSRRKRIAATIIESTPPKRARAESSIPQSQKTKAVNCDPFQRRLCLITCAHTLETLEFARVLDKERTPKSLVVALESAWGLQPNQLNLDSSYNLLTLRADIHRAFDSYRWTLVPEMDVLKRIKELYSQPQESIKLYTDLFPSRTNWKYRFIPLSPIVQDSRFTIFRPTVKLTFKRRADWPNDFEQPPPPTILSNDNQTMSYSMVTPVTIHPQGVLYIGTSTANLPLLYSHIHPFFAICKAYHAFCEFPSSYKFHAESQIIKEIFELWVPSYSGSSTLSDGREEQYEIDLGTEKENSEPEEPLDDPPSQSSTLIYPFDCEKWAAHVIQSIEDPRE